MFSEFLHCCHEKGESCQTPPTPSLYITATLSTGIVQTPVNNLVLDQISLDLCCNHHAMYIEAYVVVDVSSRAKLNAVFLEDLYESVNEC